MVQALCEDSRKGQQQMLRKYGYQKSHVQQPYAHDFWAILAALDRSTSLAVKRNAICAMCPAADSQLAVISL